MCTVKNLGNRCWFQTEYSGSLACSGKRVHKSCWIKVSTASLTVLPCCLAIGFPLVGSEMAPVWPKVLMFCHFWASPITPALTSSLTLTEEGFFLGAALLGLGLSGILWNGTVHECMNVCGWHRLCLKKKVGLCWVTDECNSIGHRGRGNI